MKDSDTFFQENIYLLLKGLVVGVCIVSKVKVSVWSCLFYYILARTDISDFRTVCNSV